MFNSSDKLIAEKVFGKSQILGQRIIISEEMCFLNKPDFSQLILDYVIRHALFYL